MRTPQCDKMVRARRIELTVLVHSALGRWLGGSGFYVVSIHDVAGDKHNVERENT